MRRPRPPPTNGDGRRRDRALHRQAQALLGRQAQALGDLVPAPSDWYAHLVSIERRKCLLVTHVGTAFSIFALDVRAVQLRPLGPFVIERIVAQLAPRALPSTRSASFTQTG